MEEAPQLRLSHSPAPLSFTTEGFSWKSDAPTEVSSSHLHEQVSHEILDSTHVLSEDTTVRKEAGTRLDIWVPDELNQPGSEWRKNVLP